MTTYGSNNRQEFCDTTELLKLWRFLTLAGFVALAKNFLRKRRFSGLAWSQDHRMSPDASRPDRYHTGPAVGFLLFNITDVTGAELYEPPRS
jgi:hypothetical protein